MSGKVDTELYGSIYNLLVAQGHEKSASALLKDAGLDKKNLKSADALPEIFTFYKKNNKRTIAETKVEKKQVVSSDSSDSDSSDSDSEDEKPKAKPVAAKAAPVKAAAKKAESDSSSSDSDSSSDSESEDEKPVAKKAKVETPAPVAAKPVAKAAPATPAPAAASGNFRAYIKGLPWVASEDEVAEFFVSAGTVTAVEFPLNEEGRSSGTAYATFGSRAELDAAIALDGQTWPNTERWLKIVDAERAGAKSFGGESVPGERPEGCDTLFVGNMPWDIEESQLFELFGTVGEVSSVRFATSKEDGSFRGFGHVSFANGDDVLEAIKLNGSVINGRGLRLDFAPPKAPRDSFGGGGRGGASPGGRGGRGGGRGGAGGRGGRGSGAPTSAGKNKGSIAVSAGKKISFD